MTTVYQISIYFMRNRVTGNKTDTSPILWNNLSINQQLACQMFTELCASVLLGFMACPCSHLPHPLLPGPFLHKWSMACLYSEGSRLKIQFSLLAWLQCLVHGQPFHLVPLPHITYTRSLDALNIAWINKWLLCNFPLLQAFFFI